MKRILSIDPGANIGYAIFDEGEKIPLIAGNIYPGSRCTTWESRCFEVCRQLEVKLLDFLAEEEMFEVTVIEWPSVMLASKEGAAAAGSDKLMKLGAMVGMTILTCKPFTDRFEFPTVAEWKGQLPKDIVHARALKITGPLPYTSHAMDAVSLGLWYMGFLK